MAKKKDPPKDPTAVEFIPTDELVQELIKRCRKAAFVLLMDDRADGGVKTRICFSHSLGEAVQMFKHGEQYTEALWAMQNCGDQDDDDLEHAFGV